MDTLTNTTTTLTELETVALRSITYCDFYENGRQSYPWDFSVYEACPFKGKTRSGVFSSLVQKGLIFVSPAETRYTVDEKGNKVLNPYYSRGNNYGSIKITDEGYKLLDELGLINEDGYWIA